MKTRYLIPFLILPFISCKKDNTPSVQSLDVQLNLKYEVGFKQGSCKDY